MKSKKVLSLLISILISVLLLLFLFSQIDIEDFITIFTSIYPPALLAFISISLAAAILRAWRYKLLLDSRPISWGNILLVTFIRNLFVDFLPARIGSLSYIYFLNRRLKYPFEAAASSFVIAFVFDFLTLTPFLVLSILIVGLNAYAISNSLMLILAVIFFIMVMLVLWKLVPFIRHLGKMLQSILRITRLDQKEWAKLILHKIDMTTKDLVSIQEKQVMWPVLFISLLLRLAKYGSLYFLLYSLLHSHSFTLKKLSFFKTILGITGAEFSSVLPIKGIGGFGTWESAWALTFKLLDFTPNLAILSGLGVHLITNLFEYALGIVSLIIISMPFIRTAAAQIKSPKLSKKQT